MQSNQLNNAKSLHKALQWLAVAGIDVVAWKCIDNAVTILIEPTELDHSPIINCKIKVDGE